MAGYREFIEINPGSANIDMVTEERTVDDSGRVSVGRDKEGETYDKIILVKDEGSLSD